MIFTCRLCLTEGPEEKLKNVFQCNIQHAEDSLVDVLFWVFSVEIDATDPYSKNICDDCVELIEYILQVKNKFQKNQETLKNYLHNQNCSILEIQALEEVGIEKLTNNGEKSSSSTPTNSPSKSRYSAKNMYGSSSPRVRVSLSTIEAMCPMNLNILKLEKTQEYLRYKELKNGSFKKRKYRHFNLDDTLLDDICSTLNDKTVAKTEPTKKEIGVSTTELTLVSKAVNTDEVNKCTCVENLKSPSKLSPIGGSFVLSIDKSNKDAKDTLQNDDNFLDIIGLTKCPFPSLNGDEDYDWTTRTFKKDAGTNTACNTKNIGINAIVSTVTTGTLTTNFRPSENKNVVKINIASLEAFGPTVLLEPIEDILKEKNYKQIEEFRFIKRDDLSSESDDDEDEEEEENLEQNIVDEPKDLQPEKEISKKQKFLDYYKNFSSFAVRELITGKKIREKSDSDMSPVFKISNVCKVLVCDYCSKSFLSQISLDLHYRRAHRTITHLNDVIEADDKESKAAPVKKILFRRKIKKRRDTPRGTSINNIKTRNDVVNNFTSGNCSTTASVEAPAKSIESTNESNSNIDNVKRDVVGSRTKAQKLNYNIRDVLRLEAKVKKILPKVKGNTPRRKKFTRLGNLALGNTEDKNDIAYVWDRKSLGKYSAISYYKNHSNDETVPILDLEVCDIKLKSNLALNNTIQKLGNRLEGSSDSDKDMCKQSDTNNDDTKLNMCD